LISEQPSVTEGNELTSGSYKSADLESSLHIYHVLEQETVDEGTIITSGTGFTTGSF
jgi:hypothetical protein